MMNINDDDYHRKWSKLPWSAVNSIACNLNSVDHVHFRSVCTGWRSSTQERQKAPLVILMDRDNEGDTIKALSFFDIIGKGIIPLRPLANQVVTNSYYLGSARGWIFVGRHTAGQDGNQEQLSVTLLNPFTDKVISINPPLLTKQHRGRVFLLHSPLPDNTFIHVVYYVDIDDEGRPAQVNFISLWPPGPENQWTTFWLDEPPNDVISISGYLYANYNGILQPINMANQNLFQMNMLLPGLLPNLSSDPALFLRFFNDLWGQLHILFTTSYRTSSHCFLLVSLMPMENLGVHRYRAPLDFLMLPSRSLVISNDLTVELRYQQTIVHVDDYSPFRLLLRLSKFWNNGQNQWEPVDWITPSLISYG
ncbi:F-box domain-containing protein [Dioscorea alata]|uniref:F-box domain-containing protein n=1 Tax=Dioscorea alata TaxID=55571 RepID=A0ACB7UEB3_DIOAL|nr:F-box domain-containing protein [Dioscorea alata]